MTVKELIAELEQLPDEATVVYPTGVYRGNITYAKDVYSPILGRVTDQLVNAEDGRPYRHDNTVVLQ